MDFGGLENPPTKESQLGGDVPNSHADCPGTDTQMDDSVDPDAWPYTDNIYQMSEMDLTELPNGFDPSNEAVRESRDEPGDATLEDPTEPQCFNIVQFNNMFQAYLYIYIYIFVYIPSELQTPFLSSRRCPKIMVMILALSPNLFLVRMVLGRLASRFSSC